MNKKANSIIFMLIATLVNVLILCLFFIVGMVLVGLYANSNPDSALLPVLIIAVFLVSIVGSFFIYSKVVKLINKKFNLEDKMDPLFSSKKNRRGRTD